MYIYGGVNLFALIVCLIIMPNSLYKVTDSEIDVKTTMNFSDENVSMTKVPWVTKTNKTRITWLDLLSCKEAKFCFLTNFLGWYGITFFSGFLSEEIVKVGLNKDYTGVVWGCLNLSYLMMCIIYPYCFANVPRKV